MKLPKEPEPGGHSRYLTTGVVAKAFGVSVVAVKKWIRQGKVSAIRTPGGHFRIRADELDRFRAEYRFERPATTRVRVLIIDDDPRVVDVIRDTLATNPVWEVDAAGDGYDGLLKVGTFRPDVLVLDLRMPQVDGFEVCRRVRANPTIRATRILAISGDPGIDVGARALRSGADAFLPKPFKVDELRQALNRLTSAPVQPPR